MLVLGPIAVGHVAVAHATHLCKLPPLLAHTCHSPQCVWAQVTEDGVHDLVWKHPLYQGKLGLHRPTGAGGAGAEVRGADAASSHALLFARASPTALVGMQSI